MNRKVQAQRKFAQGAPVPPNSFSNSERRIDVTHNREEQRNVVHNNIAVNALLDVMSFNNIHKHKRPVVLLERLRTNISNPYITNPVLERDDSNDSRPSTSGNMNKNSMRLRSHSRTNKKSEDGNVEFCETLDSSVLNGSRQSTESGHTDRVCENKEKIDNTFAKCPPSTNVANTLLVDSLKTPQNFSCNMSDASNDEDKPLAQYVTRKKQLSNTKMIRNAAAISKKKEDPRRLRKTKCHKYINLLMRRRQQKFTDDNSENESQINSENDMNHDSLCSLDSSIQDEEVLTNLQKLKKVRRKPIMTQCGLLKKRKVLHKAKSITSPTSPVRQKHIHKTNANSPCLSKQYTERKDINNDRRVADDNMSTFCPIQRYDSFTSIVEAPEVDISRSCKKCKNCMKMAKIIQLRMWVSKSLKYKKSLENDSPESDSSVEAYSYSTSEIWKDWFHLDLDILKKSSLHVLRIFYCYKEMNNSKNTLFCSLFPKLSECDRPAFETQNARAILQYLEKHFNFAVKPSESLIFETEQDRVCIQKNELHMLNKNMANKQKDGVTFFNAENSMVTEELMPRNNNKIHDAPSLLPLHNENVPSFSMESTVYSKSKIDESKESYTQAPVVGHRESDNELLKVTCPNIKQHLDNCTSDNNQSPFKPRSSELLIHQEHDDILLETITKDNIKIHHKDMNISWSCKIIESSPLTPPQNNYVESIICLEDTCDRPLLLGDNLFHSSDDINSINSNNTNQFHVSHNFSQDSEIVNVNITNPLIQNNDLDNMETNAECQQISNLSDDKNSPLKILESHLLKQPTGQKSIGTKHTDEKFDTYQISSAATSVMGYNNSDDVNIIENVKEKVVAPEEAVITDYSQSSMEDVTSTTVTFKPPTKSKTITLLSPETGQSFINAPVFTPTAAEFMDPVAFIDSITPTASKFGICKVVPPRDFTPACSLNDEMSFNVTNQYVTRLFSRWGPGSREMSTIKAYLASQSVVFKRAPLYEGMEVNLPKLYQIVQRHGGLKKVIERKRWGRVAEEIRFTKGPNPEKKLDQFYVKYLLPYDTLSSTERGQIMSRVERAWSNKYRKMTERAFEPLHRQHKLLGESESSEEDDCSDDDSYITGALAEVEECVMQGRKMNLTTFKKIASNALEAFFPNSPTPSISELEEEYWRLVLLGSEHLCVISASIDTGTAGYGFTNNKHQKYGDHPWNLKNVATNTGNILRYLGAVLGVTVPTLHLGMVFSTSCWHRDPHGLPWMEFMHSGPSKIWYGIPDEQSNKFRKAVEKLCPTSCQNKTIWLPSDITMIPPNLLREQNVTLSRVEQKPGEYIIVFPKAYSCSISTGFTVSESVYFASKSWLQNSLKFFLEAKISSEPTTISIESLLIDIVMDGSAPAGVLQPALETVASLLRAELSHRRALERALPAHAAHSATKNVKHPPGAWNVREQDECEVCRKSLFLSRVRGLTETNTPLCLEHAICIIKKKTANSVPAPSFELDYYFTVDEIHNILKIGETRLSKIT